MKRYIIALMFLITAPLALANADVKQAQSFKTIQNQVNQLMKQGMAPQDILIVLDDDGTISDMKFPPEDKELQSQLAVSLHGIGGVAWVHWQEHLLKQCSESQASSQCSDLVADDLESVYNAQAIFFNSRWIDVVEPQLITGVRQLRDKGVKVMGETARPGWLADITQVQLHHLINDQTGQAVSFDLASGALKTDKPVGALGYFHCQGLDEAPLLYRQGMLYVKGQNKGKALQCLFDRVKLASSPKAIIFVDDLKHNVKEFAQAFDGNPSIKVFSYHYTADAPYKHVDKQQANQDWQAMKNTLSKITPAHARYQHSS